MLCTQEIQLKWKAFVLNKFFTHFSVAPAYGFTGSTAVFRGTRGLAMARPPKDQDAMERWIWSLRNDDQPTESTANGKLFQLQELLMKRQPKDPQHALLRVETLKTLEDMFKTLTEKGAFTERLSTATQLDSLLSRVCAGAEDEDFLDASILEGQPPSAQAKTSFTSAKEQISASKSTAQADAAENARLSALYGSSQRSGKRSAAASPYAELMENDLLKGVEEHLVEAIMNQILDRTNSVAWNEIAGLAHAKQSIQEIVIWPMLRPDIFTGLRGPPRGLLLFGPPGTGKTLIGRCVASQAKATFFSISASSLTSKWVGEGEKLVRALFAVARCHQPAVIFMDEIDSLLSQRTEGEFEASRRIKTEFLLQFDGVATSRDDRLLVIGATNRPQELDEAARRRLVKRLYIPLPDADARGSIVKQLLKEQCHNLSSSDVSEVISATDGYSGSDMHALCREAVMCPIREVASEIEKMRVDDVRAVSLSDFKLALRQIRPSVSLSDLLGYEKWNESFGSLATAAAKH